MKKAVKKLDLQALSVSEVLGHDPSARKRISEIAGTLADQLKDVSTNLASTNQQSITVGELAVMVSNLFSAIAAVTPNKGDDVAAAIARTIIRFAVK